MLFGELWDAFDESERAAISPPTERLSLTPPSRFGVSFTESSSDGSSSFDDSDFNQFFGGFVGSTSSLFDFNGFDDSPLPGSLTLGSDRVNDFNILNVENENVSQDEFDSSVPQMQRPSSGLRSEESIVQEHLRLQKEQIHRNEQIANILSPWRKRREEMERKNRKRVPAVRRKFSIAVDIDTVSVRQPARRKANGNKGNLGGVKRSRSSC